MEALLVFGLFGGLALASLRWGADSRGRLRSKDEDFARLGIVWPEPVASGPVVAPRRDGARARSTQAAALAGTRVVVAATAPCES